MISNQTCPVCNGNILPEQRVCDRCGFKLAGKTETFVPVPDVHDSVISDADTTPANSLFSLFVSKGPQVNEEFFLDAAHTTLGRDPHCYIFLNDMTVSREHSRIDIEDGTITITDTSSLNGTWVNGVVIDHATLVPEDIIQIGTFTMVLHKHTGC